MECTGERYLPEFDRDWTLEHLHRYLLACELAAGKTVLDIAFDTGFNGLSYFIGVFKQSMGCTPTEFRRRHGRQEA